MKLLKKAIISLGIALAAMGLSQGALANTASTLKGNVTVEGPTVRMGDLFSNAGRWADLPVVDAPAPGGRITLWRKSLEQKARLYGIRLTGGVGAERVIIHRAGQEVPQETILHKLEAAITERSMGGTLRIQSRKLPKIFVAMNQIPDVDITSITLDEISGRFVATMVPVGTQASAQNRIEIKGIAVEVTEVPVASSRIIPGQVIKADQLEWIEMPTRRIGRNVILSTENLIGKTPSRPLRAGRPIQSRDVQRPILVKKNQAVTVLYKVPGMILTVTAKAEQNGSENDIIKVTNTQSKISFQMKVTQPNFGVALTQRQILAQASQ